LSDLPAPKISDLARSRGPNGVPEVQDYLAGLNTEQRLAVETTEGPVLVLAGAGTGKTKVLTTRLAHILKLGKARPWELLVVTFTNKAAREMRERITHLIGPSAEGLRWLGTFHSVAAQILRRHAELVGLKSSFTILDTDDQERVLQAAARGRQYRHQALDAQVAGQSDRPLEEPRLDARQAADHRGLRQRQGPDPVRRLSGAAGDAERLRLRRPAAAQPDDPVETCGYR
jgi:superfamily I DNA/RNA helicase